MKGKKLGPGGKGPEDRFKNQKGKKMGKGKRMGKVARMKKKNNMKKGKGGKGK